VAAQGERAVMVYLVQRQDCRRFTVAADIDPQYAAALKTAMATGVEVLSYACRLSTEGIDVAEPLPLNL
jgi:sugar fermentation stimulation protein A